MDLQEKAINIKGKSYVLVSDRILYLAENFADKYSIETEYHFLENEKMFICKAILTLNGQKFTGHAQEIIGDGYINKTSALENCETSAVGRAIAMAGIGVLESIASVDEINKAKAREIYNNQQVNQETGEIKDLGKCVKCGAPKIMKKDGSGSYCSAKCFLKQ